MALHNNLDLTMEEETELELMLVSQVMEWAETEGQEKADVACSMLEKINNSRSSEDTAKEYLALLENYPEYIPVSVKKAIRLALNRLS